MKKILCIILSLVLLTVCLTGFTSVQLKEDVPLTPIPGVESSDDYNEDVIYPPASPSGIAIQRFEIPDALFNSNDDMYHFITSDLGITEETFHKELLPVQNKYYVNRFYGSAYWGGRNPYYPNVVITSQEQLDCFFAWYCNPQNLYGDEEVVKDYLEYYNADGFAENAYRKLSAVDYSESTVFLVTMNNRVDGLILHENAVLALVNHDLDSKLDGGQFQYTYFYVVSNKELPENREDLVLVRAIYEETEKGEALFSPLWCTIQPDTFCFKKIDSNTEVEPIQPITDQYFDELLQQWIEITGAENQYEKLFGDYEIVWEETDFSAFPLPIYEVDISKKDLETSIPFEVIASSGDWQYEQTQTFADAFWEQPYIATTKEEALALVKRFSGGSVLSGDGLKLYQKIQDIDFSEKAIICISPEYVEPVDSEYYDKEGNKKIEHGYASMPNYTQLMGISITDDHVVVKMQVFDDILPRYNPSLMNGSCNSAQYLMYNRGSKYLLVVDKANLPNDLVKNQVYTVFYKDQMNETDQEAFVIGFANAYKICMKELTKESLDTKNGVLAHYQRLVKSFKK